MGTAAGGGFVFGDFVALDYGVAEFARLHVEGRFLAPACLDVAVGGYLYLFEPSLRGAEREVVEVVGLAADCPVARQATGAVVLLGVLPYHFGTECGLGGRIGAEIVDSIEAECEYGHEEDHTYEKYGPCFRYSGDGPRQFPAQPTGQQGRGDAD